MSQSDVRTETSGDTVGHTGGRGWEVRGRGGGEGMEREGDGGGGDGVTGGGV